MDTVYLIGTAEKWNAEDENNMIIPVHNIGNKSCYISFMSCDFYPYGHSAMQV